MKNRTRAVLGMVLVAVLVIASACQAPPPTAPTGPVQVEITNWDAAAPLAGDFAPAEESRAAGNVTTLRSLRVQNNAAVGGALTVTGAGDIGGSLNFGANDLYPVGNTADGKKLLIGVTGGVVQKATVVPTVSYISTVTAFGCEPQSAAFAGAWDCRVQLGAANQLTMTLYEVDATPVPTAAYAKIQYWIVGN